MSAAARAEARRKAILSRGGDRLAKLTTSGRGEDNPVYVRELTPDPPLPTFPPTPAASPGRTATTNLENFVGEDAGYAYAETPGRVRSRVPSNASNVRSRVPSNASTQDQNPFGMPDPSAWSGEQQAQFLQALMGGGGAPTMPALMQNAGAGVDAGEMNGNPFAGMPGMENSPFAALMQMAAAGGGGGEGNNNIGGGMGMGKAPDVAAPKTLLQRLMPAVHFLAVWALLLYFVLVMEPGLHNVGGGEGETGGIGFAWRWKKLAAQAKGQLGAASGWGVQFIPFFWAFVTLELVLHSLRIFSGFDAFRPPTILALALPHLPPRVSSVIVHGMKYMQMGSMFMDDVAAVVVGIGLVIWLATWSKT